MSGSSRRLTDESIIVVTPGRAASHRSYSPPRIAPSFRPVPRRSRRCSPVQLGRQRVAPAAARRAARTTSRRSEKLGFPSSATRNTVRVGGSDAVSDAAGVAGALYPATGDSDRPTAVVLVDQDDWAIRHRRLGARRPADRRADPAHGRQRPAGRDQGRARPPEAEGLGPLEGRPGDPRRGRRRAAGGLQDGADRGRRPLRARRRDRPLLLGRPRQAVERRRPLLGRRRRVRHARGRLGRSLRRLRAARAPEPHPGAGREGARRALEAERVRARPREA